MNIVFQQTSPELSEKLCSIGIRMKSDYMYKIIRGHKPKLIPANKCIPGECRIHSYSIAELGLMIPFGHFQQSVIQKQPGGSWLYKATSGRIFTYGLEVEARGYYLLDLLLSGQVSIEDINDPQLLSRPKKNDSV